MPTETQFVLGLDVGETFALQAHNFHKTSGHNIAAGPDVGMVDLVVGQRIGAQQNAQALILQGGRNGAEFFIALDELGDGWAVGYNHKLKAFLGQGFDIVGRITKNKAQNGGVLAVHVQAEIVIHTSSCCYALRRLQACCDNPSQAAVFCKQQLRMVLDSCGGATYG
jgi:hypothetical protein